jgi:hypothetical protein
VRPRGEAGHEGPDGAVVVVQRFVQRMASVQTPQSVVSSRPGPAARDRSPSSWPSARAVVGQVSVVQRDAHRDPSGARAWLGSIRSGTRGFASPSLQGGRRDGVPSPARGRRPSRRTQTPRDRCRVRRPLRPRPIRRFSIRPSCQPLRLDVGAQLDPSIR